MLRAGLQKLRRLEADFAAIDPTRYPKMLVVCEDTGVSPQVVRFLMDEGLAGDEVMSIDSGSKLKAAQTWCERINVLPPEQRQALSWHYVLLGESLFHDWRGKGASLAELLRFGRSRPVAAVERQSRLF
ncbi:hypothetical protein GCM10017624_03540 [Azotobacter vinelandii]|nr:hypothetical protein GCM10017624_03540 [Azotobacter vinelandii]SFX90515.1 hypothetical protein SAMN04244547_03180 [Azotobacter vinelandii]